MKAMIFAAGLGTRLRPLTNDRPKALVEVEGKPLLEIVIRRLKAFGFRHIIINVHHFADLVIDFLARNQNFGIEIKVSDERGLLLDTGGGLKKASWYLNDAPFLICNTDVLTNLDLKALYNYHCQNNALATLAIRERNSSRYLLFNDQQVLSGWRNAKTGEKKICRENSEYHDFAFSGIHVLDPDIFSFMPQEEQVFSIIDTYLEAGKSRNIFGYPHDEDLWLDVGKKDTLEKAADLLKKIEANN